MKNIQDKIFKYRYIMAAVIFAACVFVGINGSSIGCLVESFGHADTGVILGTSRHIRSDEFGTFTPMTWAQYMDPSGRFPYFSSVIRGDATDVFITYGQPVMSFLMIFRPFQIGYLFLPIAQGMAFFWCGRFIFLFMISFEFARLITDDDRRMSIIYALMITLSPAVQWWFAVNGFVEMLISTELSIVLLNKYLNIDSNDRKKEYEKMPVTSSILIKKIICATGIMICAGIFILTLYPAWMVPMAYVILGLIIWQMWINRRKISDKSGVSIFPDICICLIMMGILALALYVVYTRSHETIYAMMNTAYPGKRAETGGGAFKHLFNYSSEIWYAHRNASPFYNSCEAAYFIDLFPLGHLMYIIYIIRRKKTDSFTNILFVVSLILFIYIVFGVPMSIAKLSMLSYSTANRALVIFSLISLLLLFRTVHLYSENSDIKKSDAYKEYIISFVAAAVLSATALLITRSINPGYFSVKLLLGSFIVIFVLASCFLLYVTVDSERENKALSRKSVLTKVLPCIIFFMVFLTGSLVNPVRAGVREVEQLPELERAYEISKEDRDALWIVEGEKYPITNALLLKGIKTINSTNVYPDIERWSMIDPSAEDIYNRYAHIEIKLISDAEKNQKKNQRFELIEQDCFRVYLTYNDLKKLDVSYIFSSSVIEDERLELLDSIGAYHIYRCK